MRRCALYPPAHRAVLLRRTDYEGPRYSAVHEAEKRSRGADRLSPRLPQSQRHAVCLLRAMSSGRRSMRRMGISRPNSAILSSSRQTDGSEHTTDDNSEAPERRNVDFLLSEFPKASELGRHAERRLPFDRQKRPRDHGWLQGPSFSLAGADMPRWRVRRPGNKHRPELSQDQQCRLPEWWSG
jgi:hypothetical protein